MHLLLSWVHPAAASTVLEVAQELSRVGLGLLFPLGWLMARCAPGHSTGIPVAFCGVVQQDLISARFCSISWGKFCKILVPRTAVLPHKGEGTPKPREGSWE